MSKIKAPWYKLITSENWKERKEALDTLYDLSSKPKHLETGDYNELIRALRTIINEDINTACVSTAAKCLQSLATGLGALYAPYAKMVRDDGGDVIINRRYRRWLDVSEIRT